ncbi:MAG: hypothetical protein HY818_09195 [Acetobacterium woodii]|nr:hypothetical protein [Acetobacterium woodii]
MLEAIFTHSTLGFCIWDIPALIVLIAIVVIFIVHRHNQKKREKDFEDQLAERWADKSVDSKTA